ncbi:hypothetical protein HK101_005340 [Irineochytrium annulatum]|nr:hypothetical protein HK101_005340 [Irineochytrium annulatum]
MDKPASSDPEPPPPVPAAQPAPQTHPPTPATVTAPTTAPEKRQTSPAKPASAHVDEQERQEALFVQYETEYQETISGIQGDDSLSKFKTEYEKMHKALLRSRHHAIVLYKQYEELHGEYTGNVSLAQDAIKATMTDDSTLRTLRGQIKKAEETAEACQKREETLREDLRLLKVEIAGLNTTVKQGVGLSVVQERTLNELIAAKEAAQRDLDAELDRIVHLRNSISEISEKIRVSDQQKRDREHEIYDLKERNAAKKADIDAELRNKERLERDLRELRVVVTVKSQEVRGKQDAVNRATDEIGILESQIRSQKQMLEKLFKDQESLQGRTIKLQLDCNEQITMTSELIDDNEQLAKDVKSKEDDLEKTKSEVKKVNKVRDALAKKNRALEDQRIEVEHERRSLRAQNEGTLQDIDKMKKAIDVTRKGIDDLQRERDILKVNCIKTTSETNKHSHTALLFRQTRHNLEVELNRENRLLAEELKTIRALEDERNGYVDEATKIQALCVAGLQEIREKETEIFEYKKKMIQADTKLKHQQNLYEAVQSDRNLHCKHLIESQAEIAEMKRKLKIMNFQINGYKEDINAKDDAMAREVAENGKLQKDIEIITDEVKTLKNQNDLAQAYIRSQLAEEMKLNQFVKEADLERARQENALRVLISERDNLSAQLIRQNEELAKAYNQIKTQQSSLTRSEIYYQDRLKLIAGVRDEIRSLRQQNQDLQKETMDLESSKRTALRLQSDIIREKTRQKALEDELGNPVNVHRWRKLEGSNPKAFEMIQLLHTLRKNLIAKTKEDEEKQQLIQTKEQLYLHLNALNDKRVGPEALEQVDEMEQTLKAKKEQLNHTESELNMFRSHVKEYRHAIDVQNRGLAQVKELYFEARRNGKFGTAHAGYSHSYVSKSATGSATASRLAPSAEPSSFPGSPIPPLPPLPNGPLVAMSNGVLDGREPFEEEQQDEQQGGEVVEIII